MSAPSIDISFILPIYNVERYLSSAIESILRQNVTKEIILVDDGSTDGSLEIALHYASLYKFIYVIHSQNKGVSSARNAGLRISRGRYIIFLDPDDELCNTDFNQCISLFTKYNVDVVKGVFLRKRDEKIYYCNPVFNDVNADTAKLTTLNDLFIRALPDNWFIPNMCFLIRREFIIRNQLSYEESLSFGEDTLFNVDLLLCDGIILEIAEPFFIYHRRENSAMTKPFSESRVESQYQMNKMLLDKASILGNSALANAIHQVVSLDCRHLVHTIKSSSTLYAKYGDLIDNELIHYINKSPIILE